MVNKNSKIENVEELEIGKLEEHYEDLTIRYSNIESKTITATSKEEFIDKTLKITAQLTGVAFKEIKEELYDEVEDGYRGQGEYYVFFEFYGFGQEMVIDVIRVSNSYKC